jgi:hypothetical protein
MACIAVVADAQCLLATWLRTAAAGLLEEHPERDGTELVVLRTLAHIRMLQGRPSCAGRTTSAGACGKNTRLPAFVIGASSKSIRRSASIGYLAQLQTQAPHPRRLRSKPGSRRRSRPLTAGDLTSPSSSRACRPLLGSLPRGSLADGVPVVCVQSQGRTPPGRPVSGGAIPGLFAAGAAR